MIQSIAEGLDRGRKRPGAFQWGKKEDGMQGACCEGGRFVKWVAINIIFMCIFIDFTTDDKWREINKLHFFLSPVKIF